LYEDFITLAKSTL